MTRRLPELTVREAASTLSDLRDRLQKDVLEALVRGKLNTSDPRTHMHLEDAIGYLLDSLDELLQVYVTIAEIPWAVDDEVSA